MTEMINYTPAERRTAAAWGALCHASFLAGIGTMMAGIYGGLTMGRGPFHGAAAIAANALLVLQFPIAHSLFLSDAGRRRLTRLAPRGLGRELSTTTYATIASWQLLITFALWSPSGIAWWAPVGPVRWALDTAYGGAWLLLLKTMLDAGLALQTGYLGWGAVARGQRPRYGTFAQRGTFRWIRQPVYVAFTLTLWTAPVWTPDRLALAVGWTAYCILGPLLKERRYLRFHGSAFEAYRRRVPYWLPWRAPEGDPR